MNAYECIGEYARVARMSFVIPLTLFATRCEQVIYDLFSLVSQIWDPDSYAKHKPGRYIHEVLEL